MAVPDPDSGRQSLDCLTGSARYVSDLEFRARGWGTFPAPPTWYTLTSPPTREMDTINLSGPLTAGVSLIRG